MDYTVFDINQEVNLLEDIVSHDIDGRICGEFSFTYTVVNHPYFDDQVAVLEIIDNESFEYSAD